MKSIKLSEKVLFYSRVNKLLLRLIEKTKSINQIIVGSITNLYSLIPCQIKNKIILNSNPLYDL